MGSGVLQPKYLGEGGVGRLGPQHPSGSGSPDAWVSCPLLSSSPVPPPPAQPQGHPDQWQGVLVGVGVGAVWLQGLPGQQQAGQGLPGTAEVRAGTAGSRGGFGLRGQQAGSVQGAQSLDSWVPQGGWAEAHVSHLCAGLSHAGPRPRTAHGPHSPALVSRQL